MQNTVNLNLKKPDQNDFVNIGDINDNMDILDAEVAKKYVKPLAGIPSLDLDSATQAALKKAETALQSVTKASVGLGNVDNTSDVNKPVSTAQQVALDKKANLASPSLTGTPTAPTAAESTNTQQIATTAFVDRAVKTHQADNVSHDTYVGCATSSATAEKVVTATDFTLVEGARITVKFANANTATTPTLKINTEVAKPIVKADGTAFKNIKAGVYSFVYSGLNFTVQGEGGEYGTATASDVLAGKTIGTENGIILGTLTYSKIQAGNMNKLINLTTQRILPWTYATYTTYKKLQMNYTGSIRFTISVGTYDNANNTCGYKLLKNGATIKQTQKVDSVSETTDFSVLKGDLIELQLYSNEKNKIIINTEIFSCDVIYNDGVIVDLNNLIGVL